MSDGCGDDRSHRRQLVRRHEGTRAQPAAGLLLLGLLASCCGQRDFLNENDSLRQRNMELTRQVRTLERDAAQHIDQIEAMERRLQGEAMEGVHPPRLSGIRFGRYSGSLDTDNDGTDDLIRIYLHTLDQLGRFMPVSAVANVRAVKASAEQGPQTISDRAYEVGEFDKAYRSGFTGTHFTLELKLPQPLPADLKRADVYVFVTDAVTGLTRTHTQTMAIRSGHKGPK